MADHKDNSKYQWNLTQLFENDNDPKIEEQKEIAKENAYKFINKWNPTAKQSYRDDYLKDPKILRKVLDEYEVLNRIYGVDGNVSYYIWLRTMLDQDNSDLKAKLNKIIEFAQKIENDIQFFTIRLAKVDEITQKLFITSPELKEYKHFLERLFAESRHLLSEEEEKIMNLKSKTSHSNWVKMTSSILSKQEREVLNEDKEKEILPLSKIIPLTDNQDKQIRDIAAKALNDVYFQWVDVGENELNSILESKKINDELRKFDRPDQSRHISDDIDSEVVDSLITSVISKYDTSRRFYELKAKLFKFPKLAYHERNLSYGDLERKYTFEQALELCKKVFGELDPKFLDIFNGFINEGRIDVYPKKGKYNGGFCTEGGVNLPIYILLNHNDKLRDVLVLAHEMGHGINHTLMKKQNALNFGSPLATAEVASTFMEDFVLQELLKEADDELKLSLMMMKLNDEISTIHRQVACYSFEKDLHREFRDKGYLSKEEIGRIFHNNMGAYLGDFVELSEGSENWWMGWSHIRNFFYVYSYASGLLISKSLQHSVKEDKSFITKVVTFMESGESDSPKNIFKELDVDVTESKFWEKGLAEIDDLLNETETLAIKLGKI